MFLEYINEKLWCGYSGWPGYWARWYGWNPGYDKIKALVAVMTVCDWVVAGSCGGISWAAVLAMVVCDCAAAGSCGRIS